MKPYLQIIIALLCVVLSTSFLSAQCGESAGPDEEVCINNLPVFYPTSSSTSWTGAGITSSGEFNPSSPGVYEVTLVTSSGSCNDSDAKTVTVLASPTVNAGSDEMVCEFTDFQINATASSPNGNIVVWSWSGDDEYLSATNVPDPVASPVGSSSFNLTVADEAGCFSFDQINLTTAPLPEVNTESDFEICHTSASIDLSASPSGGSWAGPGVTGSQFVSPSEGTHNLVYTYIDGMGCENSDNLEITVNPIPDVNAGSDFSVCENEGEIQLNADFPTGGEWSGTGVENSSSSFNPTALNGDITLAYSVGENTCLNQDEIIITVLPKPVLNSPSQLDFCIEATEVLLDGFEPTGGHWVGSTITDSSAGMLDISSLGSEEVQYRFTDGVTGCADTSLTVVQIHALPEINFSVEERACSGEEIEISNSTSGATSFEWTVNSNVHSADNTPSISLTELGSHTVGLKAWNSIGCESYAEESGLEIIDIPQSLFSMNVNEGCEPVELTVENQSSGTDLSFEWDFTTANSIAEEPGTIEFSDVTEDTDFEIRLTTTNECGSQTHEETLTVKAQPQAEFSTNLSSVCSPVTSEFVNQSQNGTSFSWNLGDGDTSDEEFPADKIYTTENDSEEFTVELTATNDCGTDTHNEVILVQPNPVSADFTSSSIDLCSPALVAFDNSGIGGNSFEYEINGDVLLSENIQYSFTQPGDYVIIQRATDGCGYDTLETTLTIHPSPVTSLEINELTFCLEEELEASMVGEALESVEWFIDQSLIAIEDDFNFIINAEGQIELLVQGITAENECLIEHQQTIEVFSRPELEFEFSAQEECSPYTLDITNTGSTTNNYLWNLNEETASGYSPSFELDEPSAYDLTVTVESPDGCDIELEYPEVFFLNNTPVADFSLSEEELNVITAPEASFINHSSGANLYYWTFGDGAHSFTTHPNHKFLTHGIFPVTLVASNDFGCSSTVTVGVQVKDEIVAYTPNSFTPNGDGLNDSFIPSFFGTDYTDFSFTVYNRWGETIFFSSDPATEWYGNVKGGNHYAAEGVYSWKLVVNLENGKDAVVRNGTVQLIR